MSIGKLGSGVIYYADGTALRFKKFASVPSERLAAPAKYITFECAISDDDIGAIREIWGAVRPSEGSKMSDPDYREIAARQIAAENGDESRWRECVETFACARLELALAVRGLWDAIDNALPLAIRRWLKR